MENLNHLDQQSLEPLIFEPILKNRIWGGEKLKNLLQKNTEQLNVGESWEISDVEGDVSVVTGGSFHGKSLRDLVRLYQSDFLGDANYDRFGDKFPLLIKFIDAKNNLSIQLHPNDRLAAERHNSFGKNEMWYIMQADEGAEIIVDFNQEMDIAKYQQHLSEGTLPLIMNNEKVAPGDAFMIDVGRVHAIGAGVLLAEIQQTSDVTYRLYDWDRVDNQGQPRELHTKMALDAIDFHMPSNFRRSYSSEPNRPNSIIECPYFSCNYFEISRNIRITNKYDSFLIYICIEGDLTVNFRRNRWKINKGQSILIPAAVKNFELIAEYAKLLEVYVEPYNKTI